MGSATIIGIIGKRTIVTGDFGYTSVAVKGLRAGIEYVTTAPGAA